MNHLKTFGALLLWLNAAAAGAQSTMKTSSYPEIFVGLQGGGQTTLTDYDNTKLLTPTMSLSGGAFFTPNIGARLHLNGLWNKGGYCDGTQDFHYKYKYLTTDVDLLVNLSTLIGRKKHYPLNVYLIGGLGVNCAWDNDDAVAKKDMAADVLPLAFDGCKVSHNARIGTQLDYHVSKHVGINLEVDANCLRDAYNSKLSKKGDWQIALQLGVSYRFSARKPQSATE